MPLVMRATWNAPPRLVTAQEPAPSTIVPLAPAAYEDALRSIQEDYPPAAFAAAMNLISSHDFNRAVRTLDHDGVDYGTLEPVDGFQLLRMLREPQHPYTASLVASARALDDALETGDRA